MFIYAFIWRSLRFFSKSFPSIFLFCVICISIISFFTWSLTLSVSFKYILLDFSYCNKSTLNNYNTCCLWCIIKLRLCCWTVYWVGNLCHIILKVFLMIFLFSWFMQFSHTITQKPTIFYPSTKKIQVNQFTHHVI